MNMDLTHHDINWIYSCHDSKVTNYYLWTRNTPVILISCLPKNNKGFSNDFLIISGDWHDGLQCLRNFYFFFKSSEGGFQPTILFCF